ncbi:MAG: hypothetical protein UY92_C0004G0002 [Candidatus Magasanikbacteria bacterium GW2011_GWA2_56_11]|uniref:Uncharacterized protein n=1 Tax=Candidatus Magasanikbacteria bacterium GW2011_GWA2_56_11 TaxID=1619044 RepID=A0A0G1YHG3_9BACT|nr:MAG: hypothetical protein UY92_C0004G0002 [Candidatus Magasanikbacteria bacterium GW2011_GWA2_56_11]
MESAGSSESSGIKGWRARLGEHRPAPALAQVVEPATIFLAEGQVVAAVGLHGRSLVVGSSAGGFGPTWTTGADLYVRAILSRHLFLLVPRVNRSARKQKSLPPHGRRVRRSCLIPGYKTKKSYPPGKKPTFFPVPNSTGRIFPGAGWTDHLERATSCREQVGRESWGQIPRLFLIKNFEKN